MRDVSLTAGIRIGSSFLLGLVTITLVRLMVFFSGPLARRHHLRAEELDRWINLIYLGALVVIVLGLVIIWAPYLADMKRRNRY